MSTEVYICKAGQALKEGKVVYADVDNRNEAVADATERCKFDSSIAKIAYYTVSEEGDFRCIYTHQGDASDAKQAKEKPDIAKRKAKKKPIKKKGFFQRLLGK